MSTPSPMPENKAQAISCILEQMKAHGVSVSDLTESMEGNVESPLRTQHKVENTSRLFSTLGAVFVFAGIGVYIGTFWQEMNSAARIISTLGVGLVLHALALLSLRKEGRERIAKPLMLIALVMQTGGWFVAIEELFHTHSDPHYPVMFVMGIMGLQQAAAFLRYRITLVLFALLVFGYAFAFTLLDLVHADNKIVLIVFGISMMFMAEAIRTTPHNLLAPQGYSLGALLFYTGLFQWMQHTPFEILYLGVCCGLMYVSTRVRSSSLLSVSTIALLCYIGYFTQQHFIHSVGWPLALIVLGIIFFTISSYVLRLKRRYIN